MTRDEIAALLEDENPDALLMDGFEDAFIGVARRCGQDSLAAYSYNKCIEVLIKRDEMDYEGAVEFFEFNCVGAWVGPHTPIVVQDIETT